ncbi:hypothetical protein V5O48_019263 [Marasmius crinis-equi]|uniref:Uncharacterized protein n=1 Tax=Marasmius crinis-equi TaxID=585013 RepID=A0ABR3EIY6_9AGAR
MDYPPGNPTTITESSFHALIPNDGFSDPLPVDQQAIASVPPEDYSTIVPQPPYNDITMMQTILEVTDIEESTGSNTMDRVNHD